ncbi:MAG: glycerol-3-phosphate 1-O-acyltransferase PlsY [Spirochaetales bacterium]|nr:glycerol-3-phosphate 1-O-acyltransferase PlsY [Spirochaetales bacterium]
MVQSLLGLLLAYLAGSFPTGLVVGKLMFGRDPRETGSGATGATNIYRTFGARAAIPVMVIDIAKGALGVICASILGRSSVLPLEAIRILGALAAVLGHVFPVFAGFRGGKGVATAAGALLILAPLAAMCSLGGFLLVIGLTGIVSASSITAALILPIAVAFGVQGNPPDPWLLGFSICAALFIVYTHRANIRRILRGEEKPFEQFRFLRRGKGRR